MSRINFDKIREQNPRLAETYNRIEYWLDSHPAASYVEPRRLSHDFPDLNISELSEALYVLTIDAGVKLAFKVKQPNGAFLPYVFDHASDIPDSLPDRLHEHFFDVGPDDIFPIFYIVSDDESHSRMAGGG